MVEHQLIRVMLWDQLVGALAYEPSSRLATFEYAPAWRNQGIEIAPLHMSLSAKKYQFSQLNSACYQNLPPAFTDNLPDDFGNAVFTAWLTSQELAADSYSPLQRLIFSGQQAMGALEYLPNINPVTCLQKPIELEALVETAQRVLDQRNPAITDAYLTEPELVALLQLSGRAGGTHAKVLVAINAERNEIRHEQPSGTPGFESFLLKLDGVVEHHPQQQAFGDPHSYGRIEYAYYLMALACDIEMSPSELLIEGERAHFISRRFDRADGEKLHFQSLCALDHADYKRPGQYSYEQLFAVMRQLKLNRQQALQMFRRMAFNVIARNHDDHGKNIGFLMDHQGQWRLAPAYDLCFSYRPGSPRVGQHQLSINGKRDHFNREDLLAVVPRLQREGQIILDEIEERVAAWPLFARQAGVERQQMLDIQQYHRLRL